eukprot:14628336-Alexandrium_andersonii.AAC.1
MDHARPRVRQPLAWECVEPNCQNEQRLFCWGHYQPHYEEHALKIWLLLPVSGQHECPITGTPVLAQWQEETVMTNTTSNITTLSDHSAILEHA